MEFEVTSIDLATRNPTVVLHETDAEELGVNALDRVQIHRDGRTTMGIVEVTEELQLTPVLSKSYQ